MEEQEKPNSNHADSDDLKLPPAKRARPDDNHPDANLKAQGNGVESQRRKGIAAIKPE
jgi:hypothetical protein